MVHSDPEAIKKSVRQYMMIGAALFVFTAITVAVNQVHLAVPLAITVALIIATIKGSGCVGAPRANCASKRNLWPSTST